MKNLMTHIPLLKEPSQNVLQRKKLNPDKGNL